MDELKQLLMSMFGAGETDAQKAARYRAEAERNLAAGGPGAAPAAPLPGPTAVQGAGSIQPADLFQVGGPGARRKQLQQVEDLLGQ
jgi:hypothetical protein